MIGQHTAAHPTKRQPATFHRMNLRGAITRPGLFSGFDCRRELPSDMLRLCIGNQFSILPSVKRICPYRFQQNGPQQHQRNSRHHSGPASHARRSRHRLDHTQDPLTSAANI